MQWGYVLVRLYMCQEIFALKNNAVAIEGIKATIGEVPDPAEEKNAIQRLEENNFPSSLIQGPTNSVD
jgi:hypothetical protein